MKCTSCGREVALAEVCPYCWTKLPPPPEENGRRGSEGSLSAPSIPVKPLAHLTQVFPP